MIVQDRLQGVSLTVDGLFYAEQARLARLARERNLPLIGYAREMAEESGMLMSYGPSNIATFNRTAYFVDRILKGAKAGELPVEQPHYVRVCRQRKDRQDARPHDPALAAGAGGSGDRVMDGAAPTSVSGRVWHPWLRVSRVIIGLRSTVWDTAAWPAAKATLLDAIKERSKVQRAGWFN